MSQTEFDAMPQVILGVITNGRADCTLQCCVSLLHLQIELMTSNNGFRADLRFYNTMNDAMNDLFVSKDFYGMFALNYSTGVPGKFAIKSFNSKHDIVIGVHPTSSIDWERVKREISNTTEDLSHTGVVYNVRLEKTPTNEGYHFVEQIDMCDVLFIKRSILDSISTNTRGVVSDDYTHSAFFSSGIYDGVYMTPEQRFFDLVKRIGGRVVADVELQCSKCITSAFVGVVGNRQTLR